MKGAEVQGTGTEDNIFGLCPTCLEKYNSNGKEITVGKLCKPCQEHIIRELKE